MNKKKSKTTKTKKASKTPSGKKPRNESMDRKALKVVASHLKNVGVDIKVLKKDDDVTLQKKVNEALTALPSGDVRDTLESIVPEKLVQVLKRSCIGIFIDLSDPSCIRCQDNATCAKQFIDNVTGDKKATVAALKKVAEPRVTYDPDRLVFVRNVENPNEEGDDFYDTLEVILEEVPETMGELREVIGRDMEQNDKEFLGTLASLRKEGVIKLDVDLSDENKAELRKAGYDL